MNLLESRRHIFQQKFEILISKDFTQNSTVLFKRRGKIINNQKPGIVHIESGSDTSFLMSFSMTEKFTHFL